MTEREYRERLRERIWIIRCQDGCRAIQDLLKQVDLERNVNSERRLKQLLDKKRVKAIRRLDVLDAFYKSGNKPEWMILNILRLFHQIFVQCCSWMVAACLI